MLNTEQVTQYYEDGYVVISSLLAEPLLFLKCSCTRYHALPPAINWLNLRKSIATKK